MLASAFLLAATLRIDAAHVVARFDPRTALGATIDAHGEGETREIFTPQNVTAMLSAGFGPLSYRLATELSGEAWHWNPVGRWSDEEHQQGYWTSSDEPAAPIEVSYGYRLPRRGNTLDQALNSDWSRIDDGDPSTFWKSNPYLGSNPQWIVVDLGVARPVDSITIRWAEPHAIDYELQWWRGHDPINEPDRGRWIRFPHGVVQHANGGRVRTSFGAAQGARWVRVWMTHASGTAPSIDDARDCAGFAVAEIAVSNAGHDWVHHAASHTQQSVIWVSSTDPWHRAIDRDPAMEQPGLDRVLASGLTHGLPMLTPVALLYGTPEDAVAELRYLDRRGAPRGAVEMGEEPDGQEMSPEDYAALYLRWAEAIHKAGPARKLGGPALQSTRDRIAFWPDGDGRTSWMGRFLAALRDAGRLEDFQFFSFEWYPVDDVCGESQQELRGSSALLREVMRGWVKDGVPQTIPWMATEYGWSSYAAKEEVDMPAALFNTTFLADFLSLGGAAAYFYGLEPDVIIRESSACPTFGNLMLFQSDSSHRILAPVAAFHAARMLTQDWLAGHGIHELLAVRGAPSDVRAWAVRRPDGSIALLVVNVDRRRPRAMAVEGMSMIAARQFSSIEYAWHADGEKGKPRRSHPPRSLAPGRSLVAPPQSITVIDLTVSRSQVPQGRQRRASHARVR